MWNELWIALALMLIIEGMTPFLKPSAWRQMLLTIIQWDDRSLRLLGLSSMLIGLMLLYLVH